MNAGAAGSRPAIVSIQSQLVYGCAGNNAAVPLLQGLGATVYAVPTVLLSNTPHYPTIGGIDIAPDTLDELLQRLLERVPATSLSAILTGYTRNASTVAVMAAFIDQVRRDNPDIVVLVDPVMGDTDLGLFIPEDVAQSIRAHLVPRADICTPNLFEARFLTDTKHTEAEKIAADLLATGIKLCVITGLGLEGGARKVRTLACQRSERGQFDAHSERSQFDAHSERSQQSQHWISTTPRLDSRPTGTGDLLAAAFLYHWLVTQHPSQSLENAVTQVYSIMQHAIDNKSPELEPAWAMKRTELDT